MRFTRRSFVGGTCVLLTSKSSRVLAVEPATVVAVIAAAASVVSNALEYLKKGDDFELELNAIHVQLQQIMRNQLLIIQAISDLADDVKVVLEKIGQLPAEVLTVFYLTESAALVSQLSDSLDHGKSDDIPRLIQATYELSTKVANAAALADRPPNLALAAKNLLNIVQLVRKRAQSDIQHQTRAQLIDTVTYTRDTFERMIHNNGIKARIPSKVSFDRAINGLKASNNAVKILPADFDSKPAPDKFSTLVCTMVPGGERITSAPSTKCVYPRRGEAPPLCTTRTSIDIITNVTKAKFEVERSTALAGRFFYKVFSTPQDQWQRSTWKRSIVRVKEEDDVSDNQQSSDSPALIAPCRSTAIDQNTGLAPAEFESFGNWLGLYDSYVAAETRLLAMHTSAEADLERCKKIASEL